MNIDRPRPSRVPSSLRARTRWMSESPLVMNRFTPFSSQQPCSSLHVALSITRCRSEPASGSVRSIDIVSPAQMRGRNFCRCSSEPNSYRVSAQLCRLQMFWNEASAALTSSEHMLNTTFGRFRPP